MTENKRFNIIDDEWIGLEGSKYVTAIEDSDSPKKTVYFVYNANVKGVYRLLNQLNDENEYLKETNQKVIKIIREAIVETLDGARYNAERLLEEALQELEKDWEVVE